MFVPNFIALKSNGLPCRELTHTHSPLFLVDNSTVAAILGIVPNACLGSASLEALESLVLKIREASRKIKPSLCQTIKDGQLLRSGALGVYSGTPGWVGRCHFFRTLTTGKLTSPNPTRGTRIDPLELGELFNAVEPSELCDLLYS
ncbi:hypothetical protein AVEN_37175-1 [Araneus ventricosus]|uniref:Uncharacterized protein n=1 Tax=Araneus ventricosus TaxID=182803 RepID=A0A4Y2K7B0_ARAVE|nr:hypothetical protein AVEN_37175-1 [Araneus ventricosus]